MAEFIEKVRQALTEAGVPRGTAILIGCSGGPDSVSLLDALNLIAPERGLKLAVASFNHGLRPEAEAEVDLVCKLAEERSLPFYPGAAPPQDQANKKTDQAWAREVRSAFIWGAAEKAGAGLIALAHTADDQAETVLMRLIRGSGLRGMSAMDILEGGLLRPLLMIRRAEVLEYLKERSLPFVVDPSNSDPKYLRVRIRQTLLPMLRQENPRIVESLGRLAGNLKADLRILEEMAGEDLNRMGRLKDGAVILDRPALEGLDRGRARRLIRAAWFRLKGDRRRLTRDHVEAVLALVRAGSGEAHLPSGFKALATTDDLILAHRGSAYLQPLETLLVPGPGRYPLNIGRAFVAEETDPPNRPVSGLNAVHLDAARISWPLTVRPVRPGDRIEPLGMPGSKKLSDLFIDLKIPRHKRSRVPVIICDNKIVWVAGAALNRDFAVSDGTKSPSA